jgi:hypothetical protein
LKIILPTAHLLNRSPKWVKADFFPDEVSYTQIFDNSTYLIPR